MFRPKNQYNYGNPTIFDLAAAYGYAIAKNHPFIDGNKRMSYVVTRTFLKLNGCDIQASAIEKYQTWMRLASSQINQAELANWIAEKSLKIE